jgi:hypothetical protein
LVDPVDHLEVRQAFAGLELTVLADAQPEQPRHPADAYPASFPITLEHGRKHRHGAEATPTVRRS